MKSNIQEEKRYTIVASMIEDLMQLLIHDYGHLDLSNPDDNKILRSLIDAQNKATDLAISFEDKIKENS